MPAPDDTPLSAGVPRQTRRRVWKNPELVSHSLGVLTFDRLYLAPLTGPPKAEVLAAVESGADPDDVLGSLATAVDLVSVRRVKLDLRTNTLGVEYLGPGHAGRRIKVVFATPEAADACFTKLWRRLGDGFRLAPDKRDAWTLARLPLVLLGGVVAGTAVLALVLSVFEDFAAARAVGAVGVPAVGGLGVARQLPKSPLELLLGWMDWRVVCGTGGVAAAALQVWLYLRLTRPPAALEVVRG